MNTKRADEFTRLIAACVATWGWIILAWLAVDWITEGLVRWLGGVGQ